MPGFDALRYATCRGADEFWALREAAHPDVTKQTATVTGRIVRIKMPPTRKKGSSW